MVSESELNLDNAPFQIIDISIMSVMEQLALKKKLKTELAYVISAAESIEAQLSRILSHRCSVTADNCPLLLGNDCSGSMQSRSCSSEDNHTSSCFKRKPSDMYRQCINTDGFSNRKEMIMENSESASVVTGAHKCESFQRWGSEKHEGDKMDDSRLQQCMLVLHGLMNHEFGWVFNQPVDPIKLNIPDYFSIVSKPMDLGTVRKKLRCKLYLDTLDFVADVRLTFSNAMRYNPPCNDVHIMAKKLNNIFSMKWKTLEAKWKKERSHPSQQSVVRETNNQVATSRSAINEGSVYDQISSSKRPLTYADKQMLRKKLAKMSHGKMRSQLLHFLEKSGFQPQNDVRVEVDIDEFDEEACLELHRIVKSCMNPRLSESRGLQKSCEQNSVKELCKGSTTRNVTGLWHNSQKPRVSACPNGTCNNMDCNCSYYNDFTQSLSSDVDSERFSGGENREFPVIASPWTHDDVRRGNLNNDSAVVANLVNEENAQPSFPNTPSTDKKGEGHPVYEDQLSPNKALRAAMLKRRFADTILKAQQKMLLNSGEKCDPEKMQLEREKLKRKQQEEETRLEAKVKAAEAAAHRKVEELRLQREREREAARLALQKVEKTVDLDENSEILKDLEFLGYSLPKQHIDLPGEVVVDGFGSQRGAGNPLEQLGLFMKKDDLDEEDDDWVSASGNGDVEEGEIGPS